LKNDQGDLVKAEEHLKVGVPVLLDLFTSQGENLVGSFLIK
jgi:hypothetical protein